MKDNERKKERLSLVLVVLPIILSLMSVWVLVAPHTHTSNQHLQKKQNEQQLF